MSVLRMLWPISCWVIIACLGLSLAQATPLRLDRADFVADAQGVLSIDDWATPVFTASATAATSPLLAPPQTVSLPDSWRGRAYKQAGYGWYRLRFSLPQLQQDYGAQGLSRQEPTWFYLPRLRANGEFYLNGSLIYSGGRMTPPVSRHSEIPFFFPLPQALLKAGDNELIVRVYSPLRPDGGMSVPRLGSYQDLHPAYWWRSLLQNKAVLITSVITGATSLYILIFWALRRRPETRGYLYLGIGGLFWALRNLNHQITDWPIDNPRWVWLIEVFMHSGNAWFLSLVALFFIYDMQLHRYRWIRWFEAAIWFVSVAGTIGVWWSGSPYPSLSIMFACGAPLILCMQGILFWRLWRRRNLEKLLYALLYLTLILLLLRDNLALAGRLDPETIYMAHYAGLLFFVVIAYMMVKRFVTALDSNAMMNQTLELRMQQREVQLEANFAQLALVEKENAMLDERNRIMRDLHDGLGSHLLAALDAVRRINKHRAWRQDDPANYPTILAAKHEAALEAEQWITDSLDDLRLAIDSLEINEHDLLTVLGTFRYRIERRLELANIGLSWEVDNVRPLDWLDAQAVLHLLRIVQELFTNILKHAQATHIQLQVLEVADGVHIIIADNGHGFAGGSLDSTIGSAARQQKKGHGLTNIRYRAAKIHAEIGFQSDTQGTRVTIYLPFHK